MSPHMETRLILPSYDSFMSPHMEPRLILPCYTWVRWALYDSFMSPLWLIHEPSMTHSWALYDSFMRPHMETRLILPWYICAPWLIVPHCAIWRHDLMTSWLNAASYGDEIHSALIYMCTMTHSATLCHDSLCHKETWWLNDLITEWLNDWMT